MLRQVFHPLEHLKSEEDLVVPILFKRMGCEVFLVLGEFRDDLSESWLHDSSERVVVTRYHGGCALALVQECDLAKVVTFVQVFSLLDSAIMITDFNSTMARAYVIHSEFFLLIVILFDHVLIWQVQGSFQVDHNSIQKVLGALLGRSRDDSFGRHHDDCSVGVLRVFLLP